MIFIVSINRLFQFSSICNSFETKVSHHIVYCETSEDLCDLDSRKVFLTLLLKQLLFKTCVCLFV